MHTHIKQGKAYGRHVKMEKPPSEPALRFLSTIQALEVNPSGAGLVTHRSTVQVSWRETAKPEVPQQPQHC